MTQHKKFVFWFMIALSIAPLFAVHFPRFLAFWPLIVGLGFSGWWVFRLKEKLTLPRPYIIIAGTVAALCLLSSIWSINSQDTLKDAIRLAGILLLGAPLVALSTKLTLNDIRPYAHFLAIGLIAGAALCILDFCIDMRIYAFTHDRIGERFTNAIMNRSIVYMTLCLFPALYLLAQSTIPKEQKIMIGIVTSFYILILFYIGENQSAPLGFLMGTLIYFLFPHKFKAMHTVTALAVITTLFAAPSIVSMLYTLMVESPETLAFLKEGYPYNRIEIWDFVIKYAMQSPYIGFGMESTKQVPDFHHARLYHTIPNVLHPHNFAVQLWMEFGLFGIIVYSALIFYLMKTITYQDVQPRKMFLSLFILFLSISAIAYGIWQSWWIGSIVILSAFSALISHPEKRT